MLTTLFRKPLPVLLMLLSHGAIAQNRESLTLQFDFDQSILVPEARSRLETFVKSIKDSPAVTGISITGFCDNTGSKAYNDSLSLQRALAVKSFLQENGVNNNLILSLEGMGEDAPLNQNRNETEKSLNRRVELVIIKNKQSVTNTLVSVKETESTTTPVTELTRQMTSDSLKEGSEIVLKNMNFHGGSHVLHPGSYSVLKELLAVLKANPRLKIEIQGHVCCTTLPDGLDNDLGTYDLSLQRAKAICQYLVVNGVEGSRLSYKGFGSSKRLYPDELNEEEQALNRRVEIKVTGK